MALSMLAVHQAAQNLLDCVCQALAALPTEIPGLAGCPCRVGVVPGTPAADGCDGGCDVPPDEYPGQLTVNVVRTYITTWDEFPRYSPSAPASVRDLKNCQPPVTAIDLAITLWRCTPGSTDEGCPPSMAELDVSAMQLHADMLAVQQGVLCCFAETDTTRRSGRRYTLGDSVTVGPQGGCVGVRTVVTVALDGCVPCPIPTPAEGP